MMSLKSVLVDCDKDASKLCLVTRTLNDAIVKYIIMRDDESEFFDITPYIKEFTSETVLLALSSIQQEIHDLGFKTTLGFGATALFIYKTDVPDNCW